MRRTLPIIVVVIILAVIVLLTIRLSKRIASTKADHEGYVLAHQGRLDEAIVQVRHAVQWDPTDAVAHNNLGYYLFKKGQMQEAEAECRDAVRLGPNESEAHDSLGEVLSHTGRLPEALKECQEAVRLRPSGIHYNSFSLRSLHAGPKRTSKTALAESIYNGRF